MMHIANIKKNFNSGDDFHFITVMYWCCKTFLLNICSFSNEVGFKINNKSFSLMTLSTDTFWQDMRRLGSKPLIVLRKQISGHHLCCVCDAASKEEYHHVVKKIAWFNCANNELNVDVLGSDVCDGTNVGITEALGNSFF